MDLKFVIFSCFVCISLAISSVVGENVDQCANPNKNLKLLCLFDIDESFSWFGYAKKRLYCPSAGLNHDSIACIKVNDVSEKKIGQAVIQNGGIGYKYVEILLTSNLFQALKYHVEVYTAPSTSLPEKNTKELEKKT